MVKYWVVRNEDPGDVGSTPAIPANKIKRFNNRIYKLEFSEYDEKNSEFYLVYVDILGYMSIGKKFVQLLSR